MAAPRPPQPLHHSPLKTLFRISPSQLLVVPPFAACVSQASPVTPRSSGSSGSGINSPSFADHQSGIRTYGGTGDAGSIVSSSSVGTRREARCHSTSSAVFDFGFAPAVTAAAAAATLHPAFGANDGDDVQRQWSGGNRAGRHERLGAARSAPMAPGLGGAAADSHLSPAGPALAVLMTNPTFAFDSSDLSASPSTSPIARPAGLLLGSAALGSAELQPRSGEGWRTKLLACRASCGRDCSMGGGGVQ